ncbi:iron-containing alcohol dehydrogenase [Paraburkholderia sp. BCC1884]|uniref:iron-containing alcohol dehydrogenase n=1 Tax=Paraburkholderia sp. BCC1884 TaxID=2562668 RepID=UPI001181D142|nr:iron-containing alcohol dehydrogenase [Paraburkholderia sp. BCC1884]
MTYSTTFSFRIPTVIEYGAGRLKTLPALVQTLGGCRILVVGDPGIKAAGIMDRVMDTLGNADIQAWEFTDVKSDPAVQSVTHGIAKARSLQCDLVVGVGGGSALDTSKAIGLMLGNTGTIKDYVGIDKVPNAGAPVIAIPTTAGTGSELTIWSVLSDTESDAKISIGSVFNCPRIGLLDPELTVSMPAHVTAATGMDALTHAVESCVCKANQPITEALTHKAIFLIAKSLRNAVADGQHIAARGDMLLASAMAGIAFNATRLGLVHAFALPLGNKFGIAHGLANAIMLPSVMAYNASHNIAGYAAVAELLNDGEKWKKPIDAARYAAHAVATLRRDVGITRTLSDFGVTERDFDEIIDEAMKSGNVLVNPRFPSREDMAALLRHGMHGTVEDVQRN